MNIENFIRDLTILAPPFLLALTVHEVAHGRVAYRLGDPTAYNQGRLTLNPLKHLDPIGTICFFIMKIGWAKPVPVNPIYFKNPRKDMLWVSLAGPGANFMLAIASAILAKVLSLAAPLIPNFFLWPLLNMVAASIWINIMFGVFNLVPIPPLDGSKILMGLLPDGLARSYARVDRYGFIVLLILFYTGILPRLIRPIITFAHGIIAG
ncbi:MAG: site-2 protease family protein [Proteobacteria bacterium]|nr:site-2 protease family protein [Pseudomonadota bacterium]MBU1710733.1 site-2 protease family protein [Pseudomonadota bacterium]